MLYSNCKQLSPSGKPNAMQRLTPGSVICFGSTLGGEFCADTVLVVASARPWTPLVDLAGGPGGEAFRVCTAQSVTRGEDRYARAWFTLYQAATIDDPVDGMHSFVPAKPTGDGYPRFARPPVWLPGGLINPASTQSAYGARRPMRAAVRNAWEALRHQVLAAGLVLAVQFDVPPRRQRNSPIPAATRGRC